MNKRIIYDVGINKGQDIYNYLNLSFKVILIEANLILCQKNRKYFKKYLKEKNLQVLNLRIGKKKSILNFYINRKDEWSLFDRDEDSRHGEYKVVKVLVFFFENILQKYDILYYLKIDIEGYDHFCFIGLSKSYKPKYISIEAQDINWIKKLRELGYSSFKLVDSSKVFPISSSGDFGKSAMDIISGKKWRSYDEIIKSIKSLTKEGCGGKLFMNKKDISWYDAHTTYIKEDKNFKRKKRYYFSFIFFLYLYNYLRSIFYRKLIKIFWYLK